MQVHRTLRFDGHDRVGHSLYPFHYLATYPALHIFILFAHRFFETQNTIIRLIINSPYKCISEHMMTELHDYEEAKTRGKGKEPSIVKQLRLALILVSNSFRVLSGKEKS